MVGSKLVPTSTAVAPLPPDIKYAPLILFCYRDHSRKFYCIWLSISGVFYRKAGCHHVVPPCCAIKSNNYQQGYCALSNDHIFPCSTVYSQLVRHIHSYNSSYYCYQGHCLYSCSFSSCNCNPFCCVECPYH